MKGCHPTLCLLALLLPVFTARAEPSAERIYAQVAEIATGLSEMPERHMREQPTPVGSVETILLAGSGKRIEVRVSTTDVPGAAKAFTSEAYRLKKARETILAEARGAITAWKPLVINGHEGRLLRYESEPYGAVGQAWLWIEDGDICMINAFCERGETEFLAAFFAGLERDVFFASTEPGVGATASRPQSRRAGR